MFGLRGLCAFLRCLDILTTCQLVVAVVVFVSDVVDVLLMRLDAVQLALRPQVGFAVGAWIGKDVVQVLSAVT